MRRGVSCRWIQRQRIDCPSIGFQTATHDSLEHFPKDARLLKTATTLTYYSTLWRVLPKRLEYDQGNGKCSPYNR
jgi:hypothetical protein